jgi:capsule polysaccharide export protein KpsE/RkpR
MLKFKRKWTKLGNLQLELKNIEDEKMFILSDFDFVKNNCSTDGITEKFLQYFEENIKNKFDDSEKIWKINSKIHRLRKGWIPAIGN